MNSVKNVLFFGLLLAVLCGVYFSLNRSTEQPLPPGLTGTTTPPKIEMGGLVGAEVSRTGNSDLSAPPGFPAQPPAMNTPPGGSVASPYPSTAGNRADSAPQWPSSGFNASNASGALPPPPLTPPATTPPTQSPFGVQPPATTPPALAVAGSAATTVTNPFAANTQDRLPERNPSGILADRVPANSAPSSMADRLAANSLELIMDRVAMKLKEKHYADALSILSTVSDSPDLPPLKAHEITGILDQLAARVIYSREHLLEPAYRVQANDTLDSIADHYGVPALLLAHINGIGGPRDLWPGKELKVVKGPFTAFISTDHSELTMRVNGLYAGRFSVSLSDDLSHASNWYTVRKPSPPPAASFSGRDAAPEIELVSEHGNIIAMRGTNDTRVAGGRESRNTIWLSVKDMDDVYGILSTGSRVIIQR